MSLVLGIPSSSTGTDVLRVVTLSRGGRPVEVLNLDDGETFLLERDSLQFQPAEPEQAGVPLTGRYGGVKPTGERRGNATLRGRWHVHGETYDDANVQLRRLLTELQRVGEDRLIEWRPRGASRSTLFERRGSATGTTIEYSSNRYQQRRAFAAEVTLPVAPRLRGLPMDIYDDFSVDSLSDYSFDLGTGTIEVTGGRLAPTDSSTKQLWPSARGYTYGDVQVTVKVTTGAAAPVGGNVVYAIVRRLDGDDWLGARLTGAGGLHVYKSAAGVLTQLATQSSTTLAANTSYWLRARIVDDTLVVERFDAAPTPNGARTAFTTYTLTGADLTAYGPPVEGGVGLRLTTPADWRIDDFDVRPYTYRLRTLPDRIKLRGKVPGDDEALADVSVTHSGGAEVPVWMLLGWGKRSSAETTFPPPLGVLDASTATGLSNWTLQANGEARGGQMLLDTSVSGVESYAAAWQVAPDLMADPAQFDGRQIQVEVWARILTSSAVVNANFKASVRGQATTDPMAERFTAEFLTAGKYVTENSAGLGAFRFVRLGVVTMPSDAVSQRRVRLYIAASTGTDSGGAIGLDYVVLVPARQRLLGPTGIVEDANYPDMFTATDEQTRLIRSDGSGQVALEPNALRDDRGLGPGELVLPTGDVDLLAKLSDRVPDSPSVVDASEQLSHTATVHVAVTPTYNGPR